MRDDLDEDSLAILAVLGEIERQCRWALHHLKAVETIGPSIRMKGGRAPDLKRLMTVRDGLFRELQAFVTAAATAESLLSGGGSGRRRLVARMSKTQRSEMRRRLALTKVFDRRVKSHRETLFHIEGALIPWSRPGNMRGSEVTSPSVLIDHPLNKQVLRAYGANPPTFMVLGEKLDLKTTKELLVTLNQAAARAGSEILAEVNQRRAFRAERRTTPTA